MSKSSLTRRNTRSTRCASTAKSPLEHLRIPAPPLTARQEEWISPQTVVLRDVEADRLAGGRDMGRAVLKALGFQTGFTHMEWYRTAKGETIFGEIAARPPGARTVDAMNYASDIDLFSGWAEAVLHGRFSHKLDRKYNSAIIFKRAQGTGNIRRIEGLERLQARFGPHIAAVELLPIGAPRRNWILTLVSDGFLVVRHPDLQTTLDMADAVGTDLHLYAAEHRARRGERTMTKKVGLIVGREWSFPPKFIEEVNRRDKGVVADFIKLGATAMDAPSGYACSSTASRTRSRSTARI